MPITGPSSYIPVMNEFIAHWQSADAELGAGNEISLAGNLTLADFESMRTELQAKRDEVEAKLNSREIASALLKQRKAQLLVHFKQFTANAEALYPNSAYAAALPNAPGVTEAESKFIAPLTDALNVWQRIDDEADPIILPGNYTIAAFSNAIATLRGTFLTRAKDASNLKLARAQRNKLQDKIYEAMKQYRALIPGKFEAESEFIETLPRLTPKPGTTPEPPNASAVWDEAEQKARIAWEAAPEQNLDRHEVRYVPGDEYDSDDETVLASIPNGQPREFLTEAGLTQPGAVASFKVYAILPTGNERGSPAMLVERPLEEIPL